MMEEEEVFAERLETIRKAMSVFVACRGAVVGMFGLFGTVGVQGSAKRECYVSKDMPFAHRIALALHDQFGTVGKRVYSVEGTDHALSMYVFSIAEEPDDNVDEEDVKSWPACDLASWMLQKYSLILKQVTFGAHVHVQFCFGGFMTVKHPSGARKTYAYMHESHPLAEEVLTAMKKLFKWDPLRFPDTYDRMHGFADASAYCPPHGKLHPCFQLFP